MEKQVFVFVHIPKCFGTSFLDSIRANNIEKNPKLNRTIKWIDIFYEYYVKKFNQLVYPLPPITNGEVKFLEDSMHFFLKSRIKTLLVHVHSDTINIDKIIPDSVFRRYIITMREPKSRLVSAYKYHIPLYGNSTYPFFNNMIYINGLERMIPRIFGLQENYFIAKHHMEKLILLELDDYINKSHITRYIEDLVGIKIDYNHSNKNNSKITLPPASDMDFWLKMSRKAHMETRYYNYLLENNFNDMFLSY